MHLFIYIFTPVFPTHLVLDFKIQEENSNPYRYLDLDLQISSLTLYHLNNPGSIDGTGLNLSLERKALWFYLLINFIRFIIYLLMY